MRSKCPRAVWANSHSIPRYGHPKCKMGILGPGPPENPQMAQGVQKGVLEVCFCSFDGLGASEMVKNHDLSKNRASNLTKFTFLWSFEVFGDFCGCLG